MKELWKLLDSAQSTAGGIPLEFLEREKEEARRQQAEQ
jgi:hypothetical protein